MRYAHKLVAMLLTIMLGITAFAGEKSVGEAIDDTWIHTKVKSELVGHEAQNINVEVYQGEVLLAGFVTHQDARRAAVKSAGSIDGVKHVIDHLYVRTDPRMAGEALDDNIIAGKVKAGLTSDSAVSGFDINVEVSEGDVLLSGFVDSAEEAKAAVHLTEKIEGVRRVIDGMELAHG
jgi:hyperosmotically inducible protein